MSKGEEIKKKRKRKIKNASSSIGRVAVSKTVGWGFESLLAWLNWPQTTNAQHRTELRTATDKYVECWTFRIGCRMLF
jgi:hypothetical protein